MKTKITFLLSALFAVTALGMENPLTVANIDKNNQQQSQHVANPIVTEQYIYYEIKGNNEKELRTQMTLNGTSWDDGKTYDSVTSWNIDWDYGYKNTPNGCSIDAFKTKLKITFRYPKWVENNDAPQTLVARWDDYMKKLTVHENGHRDMAVKAAEEINRAAAALPARSSCAEIDREVRDVGFAIAERLNTDQKEYDAITRHGSTQGAVFP